MTYEELITKLRDAYGDCDASKISEHLAIQFNIEGEAEGALYLEIADGAIHIEPFEYFDRDILVTISAANLIALADGSLDILDAYNNDKLSAEGDLPKALLLKNIVRKDAPAETETIAQKAADAATAVKAVAKAAGMSRKKNRKRRR